MRTDSDLLALASSGKSSAADEFIRRHYRWCVEKSTQLAGCSGEDIAHAVLVEFMAKPPSITSDTARPVLMHRIRLASWREHQRVQRRVAPPTVEGTSPSQRLLGLEILAAIKDLGTAQRTVVEMRFAGRSHCDIAAEHGVTVGASRALLHRALEKLRARFA